MKCTVDNIQLEGTPEEINKFVELYGEGTKSKTIYDGFHTRTINTSGGGYTHIATSGGGTVYSATSGGGSVSSTSNNYPISIPEHNHNSHREFK